MYICTNCGHVFDTPNIHTEDYGFGNYGIQPNCFDYEICPNCESEHFVKAKPCNWCGEWFPENKPFIDGCCMNCHEELTGEV